MTNRSPLIDDDGEVRELDQADFARARPAAEVLPDLFGKETADQMIKRRGRPPKAAPKRAISIRLSPEVLAHFKAQGPGWQSRIDEVLKAWVKEHGQG